MCDIKRGDELPAQIGRPKVENPITRKLSIRLDAETENKLSEYCENHSVSRAEAIRRGIHLIWAKEKE